MEKAEEQPEEEEEIDCSGMDNVLSPFHPTQMMIDGMEFHSIHQYLEYTKASMVQDRWAMDRIMRTRYAWEVRDIGRKVK